MWLNAYVTAKLKLRIQRLIVVNRVLFVFAQFFTHRSILHEFASLCPLALRCDPFVRLVAYWCSSLVLLVCVTCWCDLLVCALSVSRPVTSSLTIRQPLEAIGLTRHFLKYPCPDGCMATFHHAVFSVEVYTLLNAPYKP